MSYVKKRLTDDQALAVLMLWHSTTKESHSAEFIAVVFDLSRPTVLELCVSVPRVGEKFDFEVLRDAWQERRRRKSLSTTDRDWALALIRAADHVERVLIKSSTTLQVLLEQTHSQAQRIAA